MGELTRDAFLDDKLPEIDEFMARPPEPEGSMVLFDSSQGLEGLFPVEKQEVVRALYGIFRAEMPAPLDPASPEVQRELEQYQQSGLDSVLGRSGPYVKTNETPLTTRVQVKPDLAIDRVTIFTWQNHTKKVTAWHTVHKLVRTEPNPDAVGTVVNDFLTRAKKLPARRNA
jgi:hypothetical protein